MSRRVLIETTRPGLFTGWRVVGEHFDDKGVDAVGHASEER